MESLLTPIFRHVGIPLQDARVVRHHLYMETVHLTSTQWLKDGCFWSFKDGGATPLLQLPQRTATDFRQELAQIEFHQDPLLLRNPANMSRQRAGFRVARAPHTPPEVPLPYFPPILDIPMRDQGDFQRAVVDALQAIRLEYHNAAAQAEGVCKREN